MVLSQSGAPGQTLARTSSLRLLEQNPLRSQVLSFIETAITVYHSKAYGATSLGDHLDVHIGRQRAYTLEYLYTGKQTREQQNVSGVSVELSILQNRSH